MDRLSGGGAINAEQCIDLFRETDLRQHIIDTARRLSTDIGIQSDLVAHAWYKLAEFIPQKTVIFYRHYCTHVMEHEYGNIRYGGES